MIFPPIVDVVALAFLVVLVTAPSFSYLAQVTLVNWVRTLAGNTQAIPENLLDQICSYLLSVIVAAVGLSIGITQLQPTLWSVAAWTLGASLISAMLIPALVLSSISLRKLATRCHLS